MRLEETIEEQTSQIEKLNAQTSSPRLAVPPAESAALEATREKLQASTARCSVLDLRIETLREENNVFQLHIKQLIEEKTSSSGVGDDKLHREVVAKMEEKLLKFESVRPRLS